jgi:hypothetical protein
METKGEAKELVGFSEDPYEGVQVFVTYEASDGGSSLDLKTKAFVGSLSSRCNAYKTKRKWV